MWEYIAIILATIAFLLYLAELYIQRNGDFWSKRGMKSLKNDLTFFKLITGKRIPAHFDNIYYKELADEGFAGATEMGRPIFFVKDLELAKHIFVKDFDHFADRRDFGKDPMLKETLIFMQGQEWKDMRAFLSPTFTSGKIRRMFENFEKSGQRWKHYIETGFPQSSNKGYNVIINEATRRFTVDVIGAAAFGMETDALTNADSLFFKMAKKSGQINVKKMIKVAIILNLPKIAELFGISLIDSDVKDFFVTLLSQAIKARQSSTENRGDFLQLLVEAQKGDSKIDESELDLFEKEAQLKPTDGKKQKMHFTERMAIGQGLLFFVAGFDTVSNFLNHAIYLLAANSEIQKNVREEVDNVIESSNGKITYEGIHKMEYLEMFMSEVMRLYPPAPRLERKCVKDYQIPGTNKIVPKGVIAVIPTEGIHRDEKYYPDPMTFDPERFNAENKANRNPYAYQPFGIGPRNCIGMRFAVIEAKVALAHVIHNFIIQPSEKTAIPVKIENRMGVFKIDEDMEVQFVPRSK